MKITVSKKDLNDTLKVVLKACPTKHNTPIITGVLLKCSESCLEIQATNFNFSIAAKIPASVEVDGATVINGKNLFDICLKLAGDIVTFETADRMIDVKSESAKFSLLAMNADDFPKFEIPNSEISFKIRGKDFKKIIQQVAFAASNDDSRPIFTGVLFQVENDVLTLVATNTHRLAATKTKIISENNFERTEKVIPAKDLLAISNFFDAEKIEIIFAENKISLQCENWLAVLRNIAGVFPPYEKNIPQESTTFAKLNILELKNALERINVVAKESEYQTVKMLFDSEGLKLSAVSPEVGEVEENIQANITGENLNIAFNLDYFLSALKVMGGGDCEIKLTEPLKPADVRIIDDENFIYIVTPVRTQN